MSCPVKYREIGDFHAYYSGATTAPYLTIFVGGNHEASSHLWELFYGGWVAPNIYYMGAANIIRVNGVRIAGMSGIWKGYNFNKTHFERLPYSQDDVKSIYHVREFDVRKLLLVKSQVDVGISHDWPRGVERGGNERALWRMKPDFEQESKDGTLGNLAATYVMDRLRPPYWFAAHMHCKFAAVKSYQETPQSKNTPAAPIVSAPVTQKVGGTNGIVVPHNEDEIDIDMDDDANPDETAALKNKDEISLDDDEPKNATAPPTITEELRAQLPAAFAKPPTPSRRLQAGQPTPPEITNKTVRFLALDKCLPGRKFLQLQEIHPHGTCPPATLNSRTKPSLEYDPEWLAITRVFASDLVLGNKTTKPSQDLGEAHYRPLIEKEEAWVEEHVVKQGKLKIPENFVLTAPPFQIGMPEIVNEGPVEYDNPQMQEFCDLISIENKFTASTEEREERMRNGPPPAEERRDGGGSNRRGSNFGRGRGRGGRGGSRGRGGGGRGGGRGW